MTIRSEKISTGPSSKVSILATSTPSFVASAFSYSVQVTSTAAWMARVTSGVRGGSPPPKISRSKIMSHPLARHAPALPLLPVRRDLPVAHVPGVDQPFGLAELLLLLEGLDMDRLGVAGLGRFHPVHPVAVLVGVLLLRVGVLAGAEDAGEDHPEARGGPHGRLAA